jgi:RNA polymerase sigma-70 factor (ECF subfamily)
MAEIGEESVRWFAAAAISAEPDVTSLVNEYSDLLYRVALSVLRNAAEAEDVVQDTFVRVLQQKRLSDVREMRPWLIRITWNLALDRRRRVPTDQMDDEFAAALVSESLPPDAAFQEKQKMTVALREIERLPKGERDVLLLSAVDELRTAEIAKVVGRSESSVRSLLFRARTRLRERLENGGA